MSAVQRLDVAAQQPLFDSRLFPADFGSRTGEVEYLARQLAATAVERDRAGGSAPRERELLRDSGLLTLAVPQAFGGQGASWPEIYRLIRHLAAVDSSLAHLFAFQHLQVATILLFGTPEQQRHWLTRTVDERWFWGNATNGRDTGLVLSRQEEHYELNGSKSFCSGALGADALVVSAPRGTNPEDRVFIVLPSQREGLAINQDWDGFGRRRSLYPATLRRTLAALPQCAAPGRAGRRTPAGGLEQAGADGCRARRGGAGHQRGQDRRGARRAGDHQPGLRGHGRPRHQRALRLRPLLAQRAGAQPARPHRPQGARPRALAAQRPGAAAVAVQLAP